MTTFHDLTTAQLRHVIHLKERIEYLQGLLARLRGGSSSPTKKKVGRATGKRATQVRRAKVRLPVAKKKG